MRRTISRTLALLMMLMLIMTSPAAAFADAEAIQPDGSGSESAAELNDDSDGQLPDAKGTAGGQEAEAAENDGQNDADADAGQDAETGEEQTGAEPAGTLHASEGSAPKGEEAKNTAVYTVRWMDQSGTTELEVDTDIEEGTIPEYNGTEPAKVEDSQYKYTFAGWAVQANQESGKKAAELPAVTGDVTYYASFSKTAKPHVHSYGEWTYKVKPTYFKSGTMIRKCSCGKTETKTVAKLKGKKKWVKDGGKWYYFDNNGKLFKGWHKMKPRKGGAKKWIYFTTAGVYKKKISKNTKKKWVKVAGKKFYFTKKKKPAGPGFNYINGTLYYMDKYGAVKIGTFKASDGKTYTTAKNGALSGIEYYKAKYGTFIFIDISEQRLRFYQNGKLKLSTDIVSGHRGVSDTPRGTYHVTGKSRNIYLVGRGYRSFVNYWISFIGSEYGMHDASWRTSAQFSNHSTYIHNGSHGCVNMRYGAVQQLYGMVSVGTTVIIQN